MNPPAAVRRRPDPDAGYLLGAHVSAQGGPLEALERARRLECGCLQLFAGNPRAWEGAALPAPEAERFRRAASAAGIRAVVVHAIYLVNLASPKPEVARRSLATVRRDLQSAGRLGAAGLVLHPGSDLGLGGGEARLSAALRLLRPAIPRGVRVLLEGMAGAPHGLGDLATLGRLAARLGPRFGFCLDTAHLCASGYDLAGDFAALARDLRRCLDVSRVGCVHVNDSAFPCGSRRDRHANLGEGRVGRRGFINLLAFPPFRRLPFILETPGFDQTGPDRENLRRLRLLARAAARRRPKQR